MHGEHALSGMRDLGRSATCSHIASQQPHQTNAATTKMLRFELLGLQALRPYRRATPHHTKERRLCQLGLPPRIKSRLATERAFGTKPLPTWLPLS